MQTTGKIGRSREFSRTLGERGGRENAQAIRHRHRIGLGLFGRVAWGAVISVPGQADTIQGGIDLAVDGDVVLVGPGDYPEVIDFGGKAISVRSEFGPSVTSISGKNVASPTVVCATRETPATSLIGFTITGGQGALGGGMLNDGSSPTVIGCVFDNNSAVLGGGVANVDGSPSFANCVFFDNTGIDAGGAVLNLGLGSATFANCTFSQNFATSEGGGIFNDGAATPIFRNCIVWGNSIGVISEIVSVGKAQARLSHCDVRASGGSGDAWDPATGLDEGGNIDLDPLFVGGGRPEGLRLSAGSPCIDSGINWGVPLDSVDLDGDGMTGELLPSDVEGNPRFTGDSDVPDTGCGIPVVVDMGAFESPGVVIPFVLLGDVNGDLVINVLDLIELILNWGPCPTPLGSCCLNDLDLNGVVDVTDLVTLIVNWSGG